MAVDTLEMAQAIRRSGLPQEQADSIAEQIGRGFASDDLATKEFVRAELHKEMGGLHKELGLQSWKTAGNCCCRPGWSLR